MTSISPHTPFVRIQDATPGTRYRTRRGRLIEVVAVPEARADARWPRQPVRGGLRYLPYILLDGRVEDCGWLPPGYELIPLATEPDRGPRTSQTATPSTPEPAPEIEVKAAPREGSKQPVSAPPDPIPHPTPRPAVEATERPVSSLGGAILAVLDAHGGEARVKVVAAELKRKPRGIKRAARTLEKSGHLTVEVLPDVPDADSSTGLYTPYVLRSVQETS